MSAKHNVSQATSPLGSCDVSRHATSCLADIACVCWLADHKSTTNLNAGKRNRQQACGEARLAGSAAARSPEGPAMARRRRRRRRVTGTCGTGRRGSNRQRQCLLIEEVGGDDCGEHGHERDRDHGVGHTDGAPRHTRREHVPQPDETQSSALFLPLSRSVSRGSFRRCSRHSCMQGLADGREARNRNAAGHLCAIGSKVILAIQYANEVGMSET